ncbi:MAG: glycosyltransferase, partial [Candidatus Woesearchaeota archaeon]
MLKPLLTIIVPAYNEARTIVQNMQLVKEYCQTHKISYELIIVDDGSHDKTYEESKKIENAKIFRNIPNQGKGYSVKKGIKHATGKYVLICDCDLSTDLSEISTFLKLIPKHDIVIGSRAVKTSSVKTRFTKHLAGRLSSLFIRTILCLPHKDTQCGFKMCKTKVAKHIFSNMTINRWGFDFEMLFLAKKFKYNVKEQGVKWVEDQDSRVKLIDYPKTLIELAKIRYNDIKGTYTTQKNFGQKTLSYLDTKRIPQFLFVGGTGVL